MISSSSENLSNSSSNENEPNGSAAPGSSTQNPQESLFGDSEGSESDQLLASHSLASETRHTSPIDLSSPHSENQIRSYRCSIENTDSRPTLASEINSECNDRIPGPSCRINSEPSSPSPIEIIDVETYYDFHNCKLKKKKSHNFSNPFPTMRPICVRLNSKFSEFSDTNKPSTNSIYDDEVIFTGIVPNTSANANDCFNDETSGQFASTCSICLGSIKSDGPQNAGNNDVSVISLHMNTRGSKKSKEIQTVVSATFCGHIFHTSCLKKALSAKKECPVCRSPLRGTRAINPIYL